MFFAYNQGGDDQGRSKRKVSRLVSLMGISTEKDADFLLYFEQKPMAHYHAEARSLDLLQQREDHVRLFDQLWAFCKKIRDTPLCPSLRMMTEESLHHHLRAYAFLTTKRIFLAEDRLLETILLLFLDRLLMMERLEASFLKHSENEGFCCAVNLRMQGHQDFALFLYEHDKKESETMEAMLLRLLPQWDYEEAWLFFSLQDFRQ